MSNEEASDEGVEVQLDVLAQCVYCGRELTIDTLTYDHVIPRIRGGSNKGYNKAPACTECNEAKGPLTASEFLAVRDDPEDLAAMQRIVLSTPELLVVEKAGRNNPANRAERLAAAAAKERSNKGISPRPAKREPQLTWSMSAALERAGLEPSLSGEQFRNMIDGIDGASIQERIDAAEAAAPADV